MRDKNGLLGQLAEAVADRTPIDWAALRPAGSSDGLFGALHSIDLVATRTSGAGLSTTVSHSAAVSALPRWILAVAVACVAAVLLGLTGALAGKHDTGAVPAVLLVGTAWVYGAVGAWLLIASRDTRGARLGAWFLSLAAAVSYRPMHWLVPLIHGGSVLVPVFSAWVPEVFLPVFLALFVSEFPRVPRWSSADRASAFAIRLAWAAAVCCALGQAWATFGSSRSPEVGATVGWMARTHLSQIYWVILLTPAALSLVLMVARRHHAEGEERRRGSLFMAGLALGFAPAIAVILLSAAIPAVGRLLDDPDWLRAVAFVTYALALSIPFTTAYSIRAHRVFTVRFVVRGAVRRLLARSTLTFLTLVPAALLGAHLLRNREQSLAGLFSGPQALLSLGLTALGLVGIATRVPLKRALDRRLRPRRGDARASLLRANQNLRRARSADEALDVLLREIEEILGAAGGVLFAGGDEYVSRDGRLPNTRADSALAQLAHSADGPLLVDPLSPHSIFRWLPDVDRALVVEAGTAVLLPVPGDPRPRALILLEAARDGDPYSSEDFLYLGALATAGGMALDSAVTDRRAGISTGSDEPAWECRACGRVSAQDARACQCEAELDPALLPAVVSGKFRLARRLGAGAMGVVYEAEDLDLARPVALKTLPRVSPELALRLRREARSMARVLHPRLAMIFGCEEWRGMPVIVMERLAGTLASRLGAPWPVRQALEVGVAAAEGLAVMHGHGLLHRDLKPSNIGVSHDGGIKLLDFGIAHLWTSATDAAPFDTLPTGRPVVASTDLDLTSRVLGTPLYCSPERLQGSPATPAADVWSLAMVLYELLAGQHPLRGIGKSIASGPIVDLRELRSDCPPAVAQFFVRALSPRAEERSETATEFRAGLSVLLEDEPRTYVASA